MPQTLAQQLQSVTLYERLGAAAGIRRIVDGAVAAHMENALIGHRFQPYADRPDRVEEIKQHTCDFFAAGSGGPDAYQGRSMTEAHRGMEIDEAEYDAAAEIPELRRGDSRRGRNDPRLPEIRNHTCLGGPIPEQVRRKAGTR